MPKPRPNRDPERAVPHEPEASQRGAQKSYKIKHNKDLFQHFYLA